MKHLRFLTIYMAGVLSGFYMNAVVQMDVVRGAYGGDVISALPHDVYEPRQVDGGWDE